jgi:ArsR family transcriptional regulator
MIKDLALLEEQHCSPHVQYPVDQQQIEQAAILFSALADPTRLAILKLLADRQEEVCVCDITDNFRLGQPTISHHLKLLRTAQLVSTSKRGKWVYYSLHQENATKVRLLLRAVFIPPETVQDGGQSLTTSPYC